ncbi:MAG: class C sortase [Eggerthellaceae bacterium]|nr:class C sortase [Eggerthellaceae bacterium]
MVTDWISAWQASNTISQMTASADYSQDPGRLEFLTQAQAYNTELAGGEVDYDVLEEITGTREIWPYDEQLVWRHPVMMAYIEIPRIGIKVPVYHGTAVDQLAAGAGHVQGTSLPVGGESSNCVLSAHSGMSAQRMFDDIRYLEVGDTFVIWTLNDPYAYRVTGSDVVLPEEIDKLLVTPGKDQCTLVTCTPYGVNSHRLLVHALRTEYKPDEAPSVLNGIYYNSRMRPLLIGIAVIMVAGVVLFVWRRRARRALLG